MYSTRRINERLDSISRATGWLPEYHSQREIDAFNAHVQSLQFIDSRGNERQSRDFNYDELKWIENEYNLCASDFRYWVNNYAFINVRGNIQRFELRASQDMLIQLWAEREEHMLAIEQIILKARQQGMCLAVDTRILTADLRWKPISNIHIGDELIATDECIPGGRGLGRKMRTAIVEGKSETLQLGLRITFDSGVSVTCSPNHRWLMKKRSGTEAIWWHSRDLRVGDEIRYVTQPWGSGNMRDGWMGGIIDGEGHMSSLKESGCSIMVHQRYGDVYDEIVSYFSDSGYSFNRSEDNRSVTPNGKLGRDPVAQVEIARMNQLFRLIGQCRPHRFIKRRWWEGKDLPGKKSGDAWSRVVSIEVLQEMPMVDLQTSTGTFIAEGLVSHNSTIIEMAILHRINFGRGIIAAVASSDTDAAERMTGMFQLGYNNMPYWMRANPTSDRAGSLMAFGGNSTRLTIYSGRKLGGLARGDTPTVIHLSEVADFPNPIALLENSLFKAVHPSPRVFMALESTGNGNVGWWPDTWNYSKEHFYSGGARLQPVFFPWFIASDLFPTETWLREHPVPPDFTIIPETERMMDKCAAYVHTTPLMRKFYGDHWRLPDPQAWFWQQNFLEHRAKHNEKGWRQEMACDDTEALQSKKDAVFDAEAIEVQWQARQPYSVWAIVGEQVLEKHHPVESEVDYGTDRFRVTFDGVVQTIEGKQRKQLIWEFVPLTHPVNPFHREWSPDCKVLIFEWPEAGYDYSVGVDTASGGSGDNTVISVHRRSQTGRDPDVQVAEFASNQVSSAEAHAYVLALASLYSQEGCAGFSEPLVAVEQVRGPGDNVQLQMKMHGYRRFYRFSRLDGRNPKAEQKHSRREGWFTFPWSRDFMLDKYKHAVENGWLRLNSPYLLRQEIPSFQIDQTATGKVRYDHESGKHDDRIFASGIAYIVANDTESASKRIESKFHPEPDRLPEIDLSYCNPLGVSYSQIAGDFGEQR